MARPLRLDHADALWHVTARGNERKAIYRDEKDFGQFVETLGEVVARYRWSLFAFVLMPNHYHLLLGTPLPTLSRGMRQLGSVYSQRFNRRWSRSGHLFQGRFFSLHVERESHLLELTRYMALNPVRADLVAEPAQWRWGSYRSAAGLEPAPGFLDSSWLREVFRSRRQSAARAFAEFVAAKNDYDPWGQVRHQVYLGSEAFCAERLEQARGPGRREGIAARQARGFAADVDTLRRRILGGRDPGEMTVRERNFHAHLLRTETLASYAEIGAVIGLTAAGARSAVASATKLLATDPEARRESSLLRASLTKNGSDPRPRAS